MELLPGRLSPTLQAHLVRLGAWLPFGQAAQALGWLGQVTVSETTACRLTEAAGAAYVAMQTAAVERLEQELPPAPAGPAVQQVSVDGAMVPLVGGLFAEVKTVAVGTVVVAGRGAAREVGADGVTDSAGPAVRPVQTEAWSYFSRMTDHLTFGRLALVELHERGTETARTVVAVTDGSEWIQGFVDLHCPEAVRILDFPHAVEHLHSAAKATFGEGTPGTAAWLDQVAHQLKHGDPERVIDALTALPTETARDPAAAAAAREAALAYVRKRLPHMQYARFLALGYPIGSGSVESANKLVVEARLKGAGMHWARAHVDPMLALRTVVCADRWDTVWPRIAAQLRHAHAAHRRARRAARRPVPEPPPSPPPKKVVNGRPTEDHPWRRPCLRALPRAS